ncbi:bifunctional 2-polyprenyl-6-hydroxyphenol methylase/3-demethylubiquinol 3-O-methyltransferase UbiG [Streptomyces sp. MUM 203J]|uniref:class I SAM-dependent methyltransferase n=1 Tax=Streptomyces sp. MUM 203J TaxID=2791990 RepID=UPI001F03ADE9|nr:class I SAM-dependent methyltransferase [Streptomyces sp. MUM 203J]
MSAPHNYDHERQLWDAYAKSAWKDDSNGEPVFRWTQYTNHPQDPGPGLLRDPGSVLEIGCGTGRALAYLAQHGVKATGVDLSPVMVENTAERFGHLGARFVCAEVLEHLAHTTTTYDAVYSVFGAAWFTAPERLFPLVFEHLNPGGVFAFSQPPAIPGAYGPQGMYKGGFAGPAMYTYRYSYTPESWQQFLYGAGFTEATATELAAPTAGHIGTLIATGVRP